MTTHLTAQWLAVAFVVAGSAMYATWTLMPMSLRRGLAGALLKLPLPASIATRLRAVASTASSCGCSGCDRNPPAQAGADARKMAAPQPIKLHRRLPG